MPVGLAARAGCSVGATTKAGCSGGADTWSRCDGGASRDGWGEEMAIPVFFITGGRDEWLVAWASPLAQQSSVRVDRGHPVRTIIVTSTP
jgi:hypothetical protein